MPWSQKGTAVARSDKALCSSVCGARCCKWGVVALTDDEADLLPLLARELQVQQPDIRILERSGELSRAMHAQPCVFLTKTNLCGIYKDRPGHCRAFPDIWREGCLLSDRLFGEGLDLLPHPTKKGRRPRGKAGRPAG